MAEVSLAEWQAFLKKQSDVHLLQMGEWGELKRGFGWKPVRLILDDSTGAQILFRRLPFGLTLGYMPKPVFSGKLSFITDQFWNEVDSICKKHRAVFLKIEPDVWDNDSPLRLGKGLGVRVSPHNIQPPRTIVLNIKDSEEAILARMKQKCRYNIRLAEKKGVTVRPWDDIAGFHMLMQVTGGRDGFGVHSLEYYQHAYELFHPIGMC